MTKSILLSRAVARASALLGACLPACLRPSGCALQGMGACLLACALLGACATPAVAFTASPTTPRAGGENTPLNLTSTSAGVHAVSTGGASITRTIVGLAIVIAVIWGLYWILRQVKAGREGGRDSQLSSRGLASVSALTLGSGRSVHLVRAGSDYVLLGATEHGVAPIHRYTEQQAREAGLFDSDEAPSDMPDERPRLLAAASQLVAGAGRIAGAGRPAGQGERSDLGAFSSAGRISDHSPVAGSRPDPMRMSSPSSGLIDRLRELTVRR